MARALKVFRTAAGFHDAYVAATSRKAALAAWGADADLFARGIAEQVTDPKLTAAPLKRPGEVIMVSRGGLADQLKAAGPKKKITRPRATKPATAKPAAPPSRSRLDKAEAALEEAERLQRAEIAPLEAELAKIERRLEWTRTKHAKSIATLARRRKAAAEEYREALDGFAG